jgi:predicted dehydrogenase
MNSGMKTRVGIIGCGKISDAYFKGCGVYEILSVVACADLDLDRARAKAAEYGVVACTVDEMMQREDVDIVINLTIPQAHHEINARSLRAGKHAYCEKPLALNVEDGRRTLELATQVNRRVGCAPDTFLGGGLQTARHLIDAGAIGRPVAAMGFMLCRGHESWHPSPEFYYQPGGGPLFDMGPYYLTALVALLGPIRRVSGAAQRTFAERTITSQPLAGWVIPVDVPTHYSGTFEFAEGVTASLTTSFDVWPYPMPRLVVFGTEGTMEVPDPNTFQGPVRLRSKDGKTYDEVPLTHDDRRARGTGVADLAHALRSGRPHRASGELAQHVLEAMAALDKAAREGAYVTLVSSPARPTALPLGLPADRLDD